MKLGEWQEIVRNNDWNDTTATLYLRQINEAADWHRAYLQIQELDGRFYWSSNVLVAHRPDLSQLAYGMMETREHTLEEAKAKATETAYKILRKAEERIPVRTAFP